MALSSAKLEFKQVSQPMEVSCDQQQLELKQQQEELLPLPQPLPPNTQQTSTKQPVDLDANSEHPNDDELNCDINRIEQQQQQQQQQPKAANIEQNAELDCSIQQLRHKQSNSSGSQVNKDTSALPGQKAHLEVIEAVAVKTNDSYTTTTKLSSSSSSSNCAKSSSQTATQKPNEDMCCATRKPGVSTNAMPQTSALPTTNTANLRHLPKRKLSVFSYDGFPALQLLEQQKQQQSQSHTNFNSFSQPPVAAPTTTNTTATGELVDVDKQQVVVPQQATGEAQRRQMRIDTLGSTGSSRASSCDEPTILAGTGNNRNNRHHYSATTSTSSKCLPHLRKDSTSSSAVTVNMDSTTTSSSSSLDSMLQQDSESSSSDNKLNVNEPQQQQQQQQQMQIDIVESEEAKTVTEAAVASEQKIAGDEQVEASSGGKGIGSAIGSNKSTSSRIAPPFESIKVQLKRNSMPNAQTIQRHIDNLISQNEAIIDNWNFVSIRSYTSSRQDSPSKTTDNSQQLSAGSASQTLRPTAVKQQRWSTAMLNNVPTGNQLRLSSVTAGDGSSATSVIQTPIVRDQRRLAERKRSYNLAKRPTALFQRQQQQQQQQQYTKEVDLLTSSKNPLTRHLSGISTASSANQQYQQIELDRYIQQQLHHQHHLPVEPVSYQKQQDGGQQLESAIQNLSLRRKDDDATTMCHMFDAFATTNGEHLSQQQQQQLGDPFKQQQQQQFHSRSTDLMMNQYQQDEQVVLAALMLERQRQMQQQQQVSLSATDLEQQSVILRHRQQQHMIDQQLDQFRSGQMATNEQQRQQHLAFLASFNHQQQQQQQQDQQASYLLEQQAIESQLLKDFLTKMMPINQIDSVPSHLHFRNNHNLASSTNTSARTSTSQAAQSIHLNLEHGSELLTQSMDSAKPLHRCEVCDISFWTRDLLNYHLLTQCVSANKPAPSLTFTFTGPNNYDQPRGGSHTFNQQLQQLEQDKLLSKSVSPPKRPAEDEYEHQQQQQQQHTDISSHLTVSNVSIDETQPETGDRLSILKHQLLVNPQAVPHESLPFKKRKISEPNMPYKLVNQTLH